MLYSVIWSPTAKVSFFQILEYLNNKWTFKELEAFVKRTEEVIGRLNNTPLLYPYSKESDTHKCVIVKQVTLYCRINGNKVELLVFWDTRQDPGRIVL